MAYRVFVRNWWKRERHFVTGAAVLVPDPRARKTTLMKVATEEEALAACEEYARNHKPGPLSRKAEYEEIW